MKRLSVCLVIVLALFGSARLALALHRHTPAHVQVTNAPSQTIGGQIFAGQGAVSVFHSDADLLGNGNTVPQIFVFDLGDRVKRHLLGLYQITKSDQPCTNPAAGKRAHVLGFVSTGDILGNGSTGRQIFFSTKAKYKVGSVPLNQLTRGGESFAPVLNTDGRIMVFSSTGDLTGQNPPAGTHLYRANLRTFLRSKCAGYPCLLVPGGLGTGVDLVTPLEASDPSVAASGNLVAFESTGDVAGTGCVNGARQIFVKDYTTNTFQQLTFGTADSRNPVITGDGSAVVFESDADLLATGSTKTQIFLSDRTQTPPKLKQLTFGTDGNSTKPTFAILVTGGFHRITFLSDANLTGFGTPGTNQAFVLDELSRLTQITATTDSITSVPASVFTFVTFPNRADFTGNGNTQPQMFLLNTFKFLPPVAPTATPTPAPTPVAGVAAHIGLALLTQQAGNNGNNTLTTVMGATVTDAFGNPVPKGTHVHFTIVDPATGDPNGAVISDGDTDTDPACDVSNFEADTGLNVINQAGVAHVCITYPGAEVGTLRRVTAVVDTVTQSDDVVLPPPVNKCTVNGQPCDDANPCTVGDVCAFGDPANSIQPLCQPGPVGACADDGNPCTQDVCNPFTGQCGVTMVCHFDNDPCTQDVCDPATGTCGVPLTGNACDDGDLCTVGDTCSAGVCQPGTAVTCLNDGNPCTQDVCNPATGTCGIPIPCQCP